MNNDDSDDEHLNGTKKTSQFAQAMAKPTNIAFIICGVASLFYLYEFFLRVSPSVMANELMADLHIRALGLGTLAAFYFYGYAPMQIPAGLMIDRFGPRKLLTFMMFLCALGALLFAVAHGMVLASIGRLFMGFGSSCAFIGVLVLIARWFPARYFALFAGVAQLMGSMGAIAGQAPLSAAVNHIGWRYTMVLTAIIGGFLMLLMWAIVRDQPKGGKQIKLMAGGLTAEFMRLRRVLKHKQTWAIGAYAFFIWAPISIFATLWGVSCLMVLYHVSNVAASEMSAAIWIGIAVGSPLIGWFSDKIGLRRNLMFWCAVIGVFATASILYIPGLPLVLVVFCLFLFGVAASGQSLSFAVVTDNVRPAYAGTAIGFNNMSVILGAAFFQPLVGYLLSLEWHGTYIGKVPVYSAHDYQLALLLLPVCYVCATFIGKHFVKETYCRPTYNDDEHPQLQEVHP